MSKKYNYITIELTKIGIEIKFDFDILFHMRIRNESINHHSNIQQSKEYL